MQLGSEAGCEKVIRAGFSTWDSIENQNLNVICNPAKHSFDNHCIGMRLRVKLSETGELESFGDIPRMEYVSFDGLNMDRLNRHEEIIPMVINDQHAAMVEKRGLWQQFYAGDQQPLDHLADRISAIA